MYELKRKTKGIVEQLKLGDEIITINIVPEEIARSYHKALNDVLAAQQAIHEARKDVKPDTAKAALDQFGNAFVRFCGMLLGEENTKKVLAFYDGNRLEMSTAMTPFLAEKIYPRMNDVILSLQKKTRDAQRAAKRMARRR